MSKERSLKREIKYLLIVPMLLALLLLVVVFLTMGIRSKESYIATGIILLYALIVTIAYLKLRPMLNATLVDYALELLLGAGFVHSLLISLLENLIAEGEDAIADVPTLILVHALVHEVGEPALQIAIDGNVVDESICTLV